MNDHTETQVQKLAVQLGALKEVRRTLPGRMWDRMMLAPRRIYPMGLISSQVNPFELFFLFALTILGVTYAVFRIEPPGSVRALLPQAAVFFWGTTLSIGSLSALAGGLWPVKRNLENALAVYQFGWGFIGTACFIYGLSVAVVYPTAGLYTATINLTLAAACLTRVIQVQRFFRLSQHFVEQQQRLERRSDVDDGSPGP